MTNKLSPGNQNQLQILKKEYQSSITEEVTKLQIGTPLSSMSQKLMGEVGNIDVGKISDEAFNIVQKNSKLSNEEVAKLLLKRISEISDNRFLKKLAKSMLKKDRWRIR